MMKRAFGVLFLALLPMTQLAAQGGPALVRTSEATSTQMSAMTQVAGTVLSRSDARLAAEVSGNLISLLEVGTPVQAGDEVAVIDDTTFSLRVLELTAETKRVEARLQFLEAEEARLKRLAATNLASATQLDQVRSDRDVSRSDLDVAKARLRQAQDQLNRTRIRAPFAGIVTQWLSQPGERLDQGQEVLRLVDNQRLEVVARAPLDYMSFVTIGDSLDIQSRNRHMAQAVIRSIVAVGSENTHVFELRLDIEPGSFPVGQTVRVWVPTSDSRVVLAVPRDALVLRNSGASVFVIDDASTARQVSVQTGVASGDIIEVIGDLLPGDQVVIRGNERLQPGQQVSIIEG